jgi:hypothetical protein
MPIKPSQLLQVLVDAVEAQAVPSSAHAGDVFRGYVGPIPEFARDRLFGVEMSASVRSLINSCKGEHKATATLTFVYVGTSDSATYTRIIDDMALVSEALHDVITSNVSNAGDVLHIDVDEGVEISQLDERTMTVARGCAVIYNYG